MDNEREWSPLGKAAKDIGNSSTQSPSDECCHRAKGEGSEVDGQVSQVDVATGRCYGNAHCYGHNHSYSCQDCS